MPMLVTTLTKKFYLTHSKDRNNVLVIKESSNEVIEEFKKLQSEIETLKIKYHPK